MKKVEYQYTKQNTFFLELLNQLPSYVFWKNADSVLLGCNTAFAQSLGYSSPEEIIGKTDYDFPTTAEESEAYRADDLAVMQSGIPKLNIEEPQTLANGEQRYLLTNKVPLYNNERVVGVLGIYNDITELKKTQQALTKAKNAAETANKLKTEFIQNMQHDIRTPVSGLISGLEILQEHINQLAEKNINPEFAQLKDITNLTEKAAKQVQLFLDDVIDFENIDYLTRPIHKKQVCIRQLIEGIIDAEFLAAKTKGVNLLSSIDDKVPTTVYGDEYRIKRILLNLVGNAIKFTEQGQINLSVNIKKSNHNKVSIAFIVTDTGCGISKDKLKYIFDKYTKLTPSNKTNNVGFGLGLYRVKNFVDSLGGAINVNSKNNIGTTFTVTLPFITDCHDTESINNYSLQKCEKTQLNFPANVLLIEDNELASMIANVRLSKNGCNVSIVRNVQDAIELLTQQSFDFVISDIGLPDGTGIDIIKKIKSKADSLNAKTPFFAVTAHNDTDKYQEVLDSGFILSITKPLSADKLDKIFRCYKKLTAQSIEELPIIDWDELNTQYANEQDLIKEIVDSFIDELPAEKKALLTAYAQQDINQLRDILHKLKGGIAYCPTPRLEFALKQLQAAIKKELSAADTEQKLDLLLQEIDFLSQKGYKS